MPLCVQCLAHSHDQQPYHRDACYWSEGPFPLHRPFHRCGPQQPQTECIDGCANEDRERNNADHGADHQKALGDGLFPPHLRSTLIGLTPHIAGKMIKLLVMMMSMISGNWKVSRRRSPDASGVMLRMPTE